MKTKPNTTRIVAKRLTFLLIWIPFGMLWFLVGLLALVCIAANLVWGFLTDNDRPWNWIEGGINIMADWTASLDETFLRHPEVIEEVDDLHSEQPYQ